MPLDKTFPRESFAGSLGRLLGVVGFLRKFDLVGRSMALFHRLCCTINAVRLNDTQRKIVQAIYDVFRTTGEWPVVDAIDRIADQQWGLDCYAVLRSISEDLAQFDRRVLRDDTSIRLRVREIGFCDHADEDLALFIRMVPWLAERERAFRPSTPHHAEQARDESAACR